MIPELKAKELIDKYTLLLPFGSGMRAIKQCALIAVDEMLEIFEGLHKPEYCAFDAIGDRKFTFNGEYNEHMTGYDMVEYLIEVKSELEKL